MVTMTSKKVLLAAFLIIFSSSVNATFVEASSGAAHPEEQSWTTNGLFGFFDRKQLKRGWQVYNEVCASCHSVYG
jgi:ubiquinol-cytochrome c reductase cytochrome c1 subunit